MRRANIPPAKSASLWEVIRLPGRMTVVDAAVMPQSTNKEDIYGVM